jgi:hypothetical protein
MGKLSKNTKSLLNKSLNEYHNSEMDDIDDTVGFTPEDRRLLSRLYDVIVMAGASGGYGGVRKRALPALGSLPTVTESDKQIDEDK